MSARNSRENVLAGLIHQADEAKKRIEFAKKAERLTANKDFQSVVNEGYFKDAAAAFVHQSGDPSLTLEQRADALAMAQSAGHFKRWLHAIAKLNEVDVDSLPELSETIDQVRATSDEEFDGE